MSAHYLVKRISALYNNLEHLRLLNADVLNCYITLKFLICNKLSDDWISTC